MDRLGDREAEVICASCGWRETVEAVDAEEAARKASRRGIAHRREHHPFARFAPAWATRSGAAEGRKAA
jgi:hypothetical protein